MKKKILIVVSHYYKEVANNLLKGAKETLLMYNKICSFQIINAPGSFEIPFLIKKNINEYDGFIALGCIIRGETYHFELIADQCARKIMDLAIDFEKPIGFGVLTCENLEQALERSNPEKINKGKEAAISCLNLLDHKSNMSKKNYG